MKIGNIDIEKPLALAPMEDVSNLPFRLLVKKMGADLVYTEFTHCEALIRDVQSAMRKIVLSEKERPVAIQIYGSLNESMEEATEIAEKQGPDFIDINCGCWVKKVANRGDGAGLLRDIKKMESVVQSVVSRTSLPVTVKTRLGWDHDSIVILEVARMLEANGVAALTVHCRTRCQGYKGIADWSWLERIKHISSIPLIGNGDILSPEDVKEVFEKGCDGVMIGRGAINNPWIFQQTKQYLKTGERLPLPDLEDRIEMCLRHLRGMIEIKGEFKGVCCFRKHYSGYLKGLKNIANLRASLMEIETYDGIYSRLYRYLEDYPKMVSQEICFY